VLRAYLLTGFPWEMPGYLFVHFKSLLQLASVTGIYGLNFLFYLGIYFLFTLIAAFFYLNWMEFSALKKVFPSLTGFLTVFICSYAFGRLHIAYIKKLERLSPLIKVALCQPDIPQKVKLASDFDYMFKVYETQVKELSSQKPSLVIFPETAFPYLYPVQTKYIAKTNKLFSPLKGSTVIFGGFRVNYIPKPPGYEIFNTLFVWQKNKIVDYYDKEKLVPFGEYIPFVKVFPFLKKFAFSNPPISKGKAKVLSVKLKHKELKILPLICFESAFSRLVKNRLKLKPKLIVIATNDAWFDDTSCPYQHFQMAIVRAVEAGLYVLQVANTGITGVITPWGKVTKRANVGERKILIYKVPLLESKNLFTKVANFVVFFELGGLVVALIRVFGIPGLEAFWEKTKKV